MKESSGKQSVPGASAVLERLVAPEGSSLPLPKLLLIFAHPDDEVLAVGARLARMGASHLVTVTDGAPKGGADARHHGFADLQAYRDARQRELQAALGDAGLPAGFVLDFGARTADQEASLQLAALIRCIAAILVRYTPEAVLTHPYEGGHPDHDACCFAVHTAVRLVEAQRSSVPAPVLVEAPFYNAGPGGAIRTGTFLDLPDAAPTVAIPLSPQEIAAKTARLRCFVSQAETLAQFPVFQESYRLAPRYDFGQPPHPGKLFYEQFDWGMSGERFRALVSEALDALGLRVPNDGVSKGAQP